MAERDNKRPNWWAGAIGFAFILPIAWLSFDNAASALIMAGAVGGVALFLFPRQQR
ncbi:hypothetical protein ACFSWE_05770 [Leucobacter albus]|uniref:SPW repeat-containing protein n=1 Tax=Leucobacter albus TaxID=272210 RepID=A0ABW3TJD2_9MICO